MFLFKTKHQNDTHTPILPLDHISPSLHYDNIMTNKKATSPTPMEMDSDNTGNTEQQDNAKLTRLEEQQLSKDEALLEFMMMMEEYKPLVSHSTQVN